MSQTSYVPVLAVALGLVAVALSLVQVRFGSKAGTDRAGHDFLIRQIRQNGGRLFTRIPRLLNAPGCGALPLYLHWLFARLPVGAIPFAETWLNPTINLVHFALVTAIAIPILAGTDIGGEGAWQIAVLFALTPQFFHALSARNFGLSSRGLGLLALTAFFTGLSFASSASEHGWIGWAIMILSAYLIFAFNTFGAQALFILAALLSLVTFRFAQLGGIAGGLAIFVAAHPRYSIAYLGHTQRFIRAYARDLAPVYILARRHSIWRDLVWDIWRRIWLSPVGGLSYAYENSVLVVTVLSPMAICAGFFRFSDLYGQWPRADFACDVAICGILAMLLTSFRRTRFLGEPERYVEAITPWSTIAGGIYVMSVFGTGAIWATLALFVTLDIVQILLSRRLSNHIERKSFKIDEAEESIRKHLGEDVRLCSNNEQITKFFLRNDWDFSYCIAVGEPYCGMAVNEAFRQVPFLKREACERIAETYKVNAVVLDPTEFDTIFARQPDNLRSVTQIFSAPGLKVIALDWNDADTASVNRSIDL